MKFRSLCLLLLILLGVPWLPAAAAPGPQRHVYSQQPQELGFLGFLYQDTAQGRRLLEVVPGSPADRAGLRVGDLVLGEPRPLLLKHVTPGFFEHRAPEESTELEVSSGGVRRLVRLEWEPVTEAFVAAVRSHVGRDTVLEGVVEETTPTEVGVRLQMPVSDPVLRTQKVTFLRDRERVVVGRVQDSFDAWRLVVSVDPELPAPRVGDRAQLRLVNVPPGWEGWVPPSKQPAPKPEKRRLRLPARQLDDHLKMVKMEFEALLTQVPAEHQELARTVRFQVDKDTGINAYATRDEKGPYVAVTRGLAETVLLLSFNLAEAEDAELQKALEDIDTLALVKGIGSERTPLPRGFIRKMKDQKFATRVAQIACSIYDYVLGHELGHHCLGHLSGAALDGATLAALERLAEDREAEHAADEWGAFTVHWRGREKKPVVVFALFMGLVESYQGYDLPPEFLRTHPGWALRATHLEQVFQGLEER